MTDIFIPTLRTDRISKIVNNILETTNEIYHIYFILEKADFERLKSSQTQDYTFLLNKRSQSYAGAINSAFEQTLGSYFFTGADDIVFQKGWLINALALMSDIISVVGTNDQFNREVLSGTHATHYLVKREYIEEIGGTIDNSFPVLYEYKHNYCDTEFIETAKKRGVFKPCLSSIVRHNHWTKGRSKFDEVYKKSHLTKDEDKLTYENRSYLWK